MNTSTDEYQEVISAVQGFYARKDSAHNLEHALRVRDWGRKIAQAENAELRAVELAAILHDIGRSGTLEKTHAESSAALGKNVLQKLGYSEDLIQKVIGAVVSHSREGGHEPLSLEAKVLYDADKLDFVGPIGIARLFTWGGKEGKPFFGPNSCEEFYCERIRNYANHLFTDSAKKYFMPLFEYSEDFWHQLSKLKA
ncbi:HD domain-containing protein [Desulfitobacterium sp. AusDCA]